jgi:hypothetical protein
VVKNSDAKAIDPHPRKTMKYGFDPARLATKILTAGGQRIPTPKTRFNR